LLPFFNAFLMDGPYKGHPSNPTQAESILHKQNQWPREALPLLDGGDRAFKGFTEAKSYWTA
jgi:hypothetical protein